MRRKIIFTIVALVVIGSYVGYRMYNKPHKDVAASTADVQISAQSLFAAFSEDEASAIEAYAEKILCLNGQVDHVDLSNDEEPQLVLQVADNEGFVRCGFGLDAKPDLANLHGGDQVQLKGLCKGKNGDASLDLLMDEEVILSDCTIVDECK